MIFQCEDLERALRSPELLPDARAHAERCRECREQLYLWEEISRVAPALHEEWESDSLWPRIRAALAAEMPRRTRPREMVGRTPRSAAGPPAGPPVLWPRQRVQGDPRGPGGPPHQLAGHRRTRPLWRWAMAVAAMVAMAVVLLPRRESKPMGRELLTDAALEEVQQAEAAYARSIDKLAAVADPAIEQSATPLAAAYREKLVLLDAAIADLRNNVERNRYNTYLRTELAALYGEKQKTLREWMDYAKRN